MKQSVSPEEYIALLNRELKEHPCYQPGMEFVPVPEGATGPSVTGYKMNNLNGRKEVFREVAWKIHARFRAEE